MNELISHSFNDAFIVPDNEMKLCMWTAVVQLEVHKSPLYYYETLSTLIVITLRPIHDFVYTHLLCYRKILTRGSVDRSIEPSSQTVRALVKGVGTRLSPTLCTKEMRSWRLDSIAMLRAVL